MSASGVDSYTVTSTSKTGNVFTIAKTAAGVVARTCTDPGKFGCPSGTKGW